MKKEYLILGGLGAAAFLLNKRVLPASASQSAVSSPSGPVSVLEIPSQKSLDELLAAPVPNVNTGQATKAPIYFASGGVLKPAQAVTNPNGTISTFYPAEFNNSEVVGYNIIGNIIRLHLAGGLSADIPYTVVNVQALKGA